VTRALAIVVHNWPLKLAAIGLASILYAGVVLSQNVQTFPGPVEIKVIGQPTDAVIVGNLPAVTDIRYVAPTDIAGRLTTASFTPSIDLSNVTPTTSQPTVSAEVHMDVADKRIRIISFQPQFVSVQLDPLTQKSVPIEVKTGAVPSGLDIGPPKLSVDRATVSGPDSNVRLVTAVQAPVLVQSSGIDVHEDVPLIAVDALGNPVTPVDINPEMVHVDVTVGSQVQTRNLPINPVVTGAPALGFIVSAITVNPTVVNVQGDADQLGGLARIDTAPISIEQAKATTSATVPLALPDGVVAISASQVSVTVTLVAVSGTRAFSAGLVLSGARDDRRYSLSTDQVIVTLGGTLADLDTLQGRSFTATLDVSALAIGSHDVGVKLNVPTGIKVNAISPPRVTVTVAAVPPSPTPTATAAPPPSPSP
jgi:YbbR domain-containing protein